MKFTFLTIFPNLIECYFQDSILKRAIDGGVNWRVDFYKFLRRVLVTGKEHKEKLIENWVGWVEAGNGWMTPEALLIRRLIESISWE